MTICRQDVELRLTEAGISWHRLELDGDWSVIVSAYGGRVYGPFAGATAESANWIPQAFATEIEFADLVQSTFWNVGGERVWIGPEIRYMIPDRSNYWGSYHLPEVMDPGEHSLEHVPDQVKLLSGFDLTSFLAPLGSVHIDIEMTVSAAANPLRRLTDFESRWGSVSYSGYTSEVHVTQTGDRAILSESWNLNQVPAGGVALIPAASDAEVTDYYEPVDGFLSRPAGGLTVELNGAQRFKIGAKAAQIFGRVGYIRHAGTSPDAFTLLVRSFANDPSGEYTEEPDFSPGVQGDSVHLYNDDGALGGFAELEARGRTIGMRAGRTHSVDHFSTWCYHGSAQELADVARELLGMELPNTITDSTGVTL